MHGFSVIQCRKTSGCWILFCAQGFGASEVFNEFHGEIVTSEQQVAGPDGRSKLDWIGDRAGCAGLDGHRQKGLIDGQAVGQPE